MKALGIVTASVVVFLCGAAVAEPVTLIYEDGPQDPLWVPEEAEELGIAFPEEELIDANWWETEETACEDGPVYDDPLITNAMVSITNLTGRNFHDVWYVGDFSESVGFETTLTNFDGWVNSGYAFKIDRQGVNVPLFWESYAPANEIFEAGETWESSSRTTAMLLACRLRPWEAWALAAEAASPWISTHPAASSCPNQPRWPSWPLAAWASS
jgi:hypothetical protein